MDANRVRTTRATRNTRPGAQPGLTPGHRAHLGSVVLEADREEGRFGRLARRVAPDARADPGRLRRLVARSGARAATVSFFSSSSQRACIGTRDLLDRVDRIGRGDHPGMAGPVLDTARIEAHHHVVGPGAGRSQGGPGSGLDVSLGGPGRPRREREGDADEEHQDDGTTDEEPGGLCHIPCRAARRDPDHDRDDSFEPQDRGLGCECDRRVDERPIRNMDGRDERREGEQDDRIDEERGEVG